MTHQIHYLLVGLPYSGKTTLAKELLKLGQFAHINIDQLKWDRGYVEVGDDVPDEVWNEIFIEADGWLKKYLEQGLNVVNEYAWITKEWRDRARKVASEAGVETKVIYIKIPVETIMNRWKDNIRSRERFHWPEKEMQDLLKEFQEPMADEQVLIYDQTMPVSDWIQQNLNLQGQALKV